MPGFVLIFFDYIGLYSDKVIDPSLKQEYIRAAKVIKKAAKKRGFCLRQSTLASQNERTAEKKTGIGLRFNFDFWAFVTRPERFSWRKGANGRKTGVSGMSEMDF